MKIKKLCLTALLCLSLATVALAEGDTPIGNRAGDTPIGNVASPPPPSIIQTILTLVFGK